MRIPLILSIALLVPAVGCSSNGRHGGDVLDRLRAGDTRVLDAVEVSGALMRSLEQQGAHATYAAGRAFEDRGLSESAMILYQRDLARGETWWAARSGVRLARIHAARGRWSEAAEAADASLAIDPFDTDAAYWAGEARYRDDRFEALLAWLDTRAAFDPFDGERLETEPLRREMLLWRAVAAWETEDPAAPEAMVDAFVFASADEIHRRLYLYLFYRAGALDRFDPVQRLVLEAVYRAAIGEDAEARRLMRMVEPEAMMALVADAPAQFAGTLRAMSVSADTGWSAWMDRLAIVAAQLGSPRGGDAAAWVRWAQLGSSDDPAAIAALVDGTPVESELYQATVRRWVAAAVEDPIAGEEIVRTLERWGAPADVWTIAIDRLLPGMVRGGRWAEIARLATRLEAVAEADAAREHLLIVNAFALRAGLPVGAAGRAAELPPSQRVPPDWFAMLRRVLESSEWEPAAVVDSAAELPLPQVPPLRDPAARLRAHGLALLTVGLADDATRLLLRAALDPSDPGVLLASAAELARQGYPRHALDVARRTVARSGREPTVSELSILYPLVYRSEIEAAASRYGLDPALVTALIREESHFNPNARSPVGATGLMQLMPATAEDVVRRMGLSDVDLDNPGDNLALGTFYLDYLSGRVTDPILRLAAYNAGQGRARTWQAQFGDLPPLLRIEAIPFVETRWYLRRIAVSAAIYRYRRDGTDPVAALRQFLEETNE